MSAPQDATHLKAVEGDDGEGHMPFRFRNASETKANDAEETSGTGADADVERSDNDVEGHMPFRS